MGTILSAAALGFALALAGSARAGEDPPGQPITPRSYGDEGLWDCGEVERMIPRMRPGPTRDWLTAMHEREGCRARLVAHEGATHADPGATGKACEGMAASLAGTGLMDAEKAALMPRYRRSCQEGGTPDDGGP